MAYKTVSIPGLLGLNLDENPDSLQPGELTVATNAIRRGNMVGTRPAATQSVESAYASGGVAQDLTDAPAIEGSFEYRKNFDENRRLLLVANRTTAPAGDDIYYGYDSNLDLTTNSIDLQAGSGHAYSFANFQNTVWVTGGPTDKSQAGDVDIAHWDGSAVGTALTKITLTDKGTTDVLRPKFVTTFKNYVLVGGLQEDGSATGYPSASNNAAVVRYADFATDPTQDVNWRDSNTIGYNAVRVGSDAYGRTFMTGFAEYKDNRGTFLLILGNRNIAAVQLDTQFGNDFIVVDDIANGCVHERAFVPLGLDSGEAVYVSENGIHSMRQSQQFGGRDEAFLSWKIRPFFNSLNRSRLHHTVGAYAPKLGVVLFAVSTGTSSTHNAIIALDVKDTSELNAQTARWYGPWKLGGEMQVSDMGYYRDEDDVPQLYIFTTAGKVLVLNEDTHVDLTSSAFTTHLRTADTTLGRADLEKRIGDTTVTIGTDVGGYNLTHRTFFDFGTRASTATTPNVKSLSGAVIDTGVIGTATIGSSFEMFAKKIYTRGRGYSVSHEFSTSGANEPFFIGRIDQQIAAAGEDSGDTGG